MTTTRHRSDIDQLYGLEPVFEPGSHAALESWVDVQCPYCGERFGLTIDLTSQTDGFIEDCQVCCQPMQLTIRIDDSGILRQVRARRLDE